jgi:Penicillin binding protein transpeptidase domain/Penicillin-binding Protein dimerisation domain/NTF2-like N-terminal transpeptidase domain
MQNVAMPRSRRRRSRWLAGAALVVLAGAAVGALVAVRTPGSSSAASPTGPDPRSTVRAFVLAWQVGDVETMYSLLSRSSHRQVSLRGFRHAYEEAAATATLEHVLAIGRMHVRPTAATLTIEAQTRLFGDLRVPVSLPLVRGRHGYRVGWVPSLTFPGLQPGERLVRRSRAPHGRGRIRARGGEVLAEGPATDRVYPQGSAFSVVTGYMKPPTPAQARQRAQLGWPAHLPFGQGGLEGSLDRLLAGAPRIELVAVSAGGRRSLAVRPGRAPHDVTTTLQLPIQEAASTALGGRYGGVVVLAAKTGAVEADVGLGMDALQPPGSSFKTVTVSAALKAGVATPESAYAYARDVVLNGWRLRNYHHEDCGGSLVLAFAVSCNSVFAPLADSVGAARLVAMATAFGFNRKPTIAYPVPTSVTRPAGAMPSDLSLGVAGIGQGGVDASPLQMASVAQTIGSRGVQHPPHVVYTPTRRSDRQPPRRVIPARIAAQVRTMMEAVVTEGTGTAAALPGVTVAGKTGTAEVGARPSDAWFIAFAPAQAPRVAVAVLVVNGGVGGEVAAPIARQVLSAALGLG